MNPIRLLAIALTMALGCNAPNPPVVPPTEGYATTTDSVQLHYSWQGIGSDTLIFIHGGPGLSSAMYLPDLEPLLARYTILAYDQRGSGGSTLVSDSLRLGINDHVADLEAVRRAIGSDRISLLGHSWGGAIAFKYAVAYPQHVARVILVDAMPPRATPFDQEFETAVWSRIDSTDHGAMSEALKQWTSGDDPAAGCRTFMSLLGGAYVADSITGARVRGDPCAGTPEALRNSMVVNMAGNRSLGDYDWRTQAKALRVPVLVIHGERDPIPITSSQEWAALIPGARMVVVQGSGHFPYAEQPEQFMAALEGFLED